MGRCARRGVGERADSRWSGGERGEARDPRRRERALGEPRPEPVGVQGRGGGDVLRRGRGQAAVARPAQAEGAHTLRDSALDASALAEEPPARLGLRPSPGGRDRLVLRAWRQPEPAAPCGPARAAWSSRASAARSAGSAAPAGAGAARRRPSGGPVTAESNLFSGLRAQLTSRSAKGKTTPVSRPAPSPAGQPGIYHPQPHLARGRPGTVQAGPGPRPPNGQFAPGTPLSDGKPPGDQYPGPPGAPRPLPSPVPGTARGAPRRPAPGGVRRPP